ncbi:MAG TPA: L-aspartate oxidase [Candidatus Dormibacteraeota bacterium]|nr:L-aspartate oxidase [Candidatus Dormibacteraeota bacterium]
MGRAGGQEVGSPGSAGEAACFDVVIVGSGVAGLTAAVTAARTARPARARVAVVTAGGLVGGCTREAQGGIAAAFGEGDSPELHAADTIDAGRGLCDEDAVRVLCGEGPHRVLELAELGVRFDRDADGALRLGQEAGHRRRRIVHAGGDATGHATATALADRVRDLAPQVALYEGHLAVSLLRDGDGSCAGVLAVDLRSGATTRLLAPSTVLASGGAGRLWRRTTNPDGANGAAIALAWAAGAEVEALELVQFHPTVLALEGAPAFLVSEAVRGEGAHVVDGHGRRFLFDSHDRGELAPRDAVASAIWRELERSGEPAVYLDCRPVGPRVRERFPTVSSVLAGYGLDITRDLVPITPAAHYTMGGVRTDLDGAASIPGLFAAGEAASTRVHGANRLASNSLLEGAVFGHRAARAALRRAAEHPLPSAVEPVVRPGGGAASGGEGLGARLGDAMWSGCGLVRDERGLREAAATAAEVAAAAARVPFPLSASLGAAARTASLVCEAALLREESRGAHRRSDRPQTVDTHRGTWVLSNTREPRLDGHA